jgi:hypothetical protein
VALPATDSFTGTNGTALQTYSSNWGINAGGFVINTNAFAPASGGNECGARWTADSFNNDQYAQCVLTAKEGTTNFAAGIGVRHAAAGTATYYGYYQDGGGNGFCFKNVAGTWTLLGAAFSSAATSTTLRLEANGTTLTVKHNGASQGTRTDSSITSGAAGVTGYSNSTSMRADDWEGGNLAAAGAIVGSTAIAFSSTSTLTGAGALAAAASFAFASTTSVLRGAGALTGTSALTFSSTSTASGAGALAGTSAMSFTPTGVLVGSGVLAGTSSMVFAATGTLTPPSGSMVGSTAVAFSSTSVLRGTGALAGSLQVQFASTSFLQVNVPIAGTSVMQFSATGLLIDANGEIVPTYRAGARGSNRSASATSTRQVVARPRIH